jgi:hypothetical protein
LVIGIRRSQWLTWGRRPVAATLDYGDLGAESCGEGRCIAAVLRLPRRAGLRNAFWAFVASFRTLSVACAVAFLAVFFAVSPLARAILAQSSIIAVCAVRLGASQARATSPASTEHVRKKPATSAPKAQQRPPAIVSTLHI